MRDHLDRQRRVQAAVRPPADESVQSDRRAGGSCARIEGPPRPYFGPVALLALAGAAGADRGGAACSRGATPVPTELRP